MAKEGFAKKVPQHLKSLHEKDQEKRLIVVLESASLESVKVGKQYELLNCDKHKHLAKKLKKDMATCRPDITHQVIKNPILNHLPTGCTKLATSFQAEEVVDIKTLVPEDKPIVFVVGAMAHGSVDPDYTENTVSFSNYPLSAALTCAKLCNAFEEKWKVV